MVEVAIQIYTIFFSIVRRGRQPNLIPRLKPDRPSPRCPQVETRLPRCPQVETWGYTNEVRLRGLNIRCVLATSSAPIKGVRIRLLDGSLELIEVYFV
ncbi:MAG TPA: hypothetical protein DD990_28610 [Cyanobacteria bacterium UBA11368]|nr:hypothetical protein [Cyanobacteria bacterium UBA11368]